MKTRVNLKESNRMNRLRCSSELITKNSLTGRMNNTKWIELFELIESINCEFRIKLLTDSEEMIRNCWNKDVIELAKHEVLTENFGEHGFIEFKEIERIDIVAKNDFKSVCEEVKSITSSFQQTEGEISIFGYLL